MQTSSCHNGQLGSWDADILMTKATTERSLYEASIGERAITDDTGFHGDRHRYDSV